MVEVLVRLSHGQEEDQAEAGILCPLRMILVAGLLGGDILLHVAVASCQTTQVVVQEEVGMRAAVHLEPVCCF